MHLPGQHNPGSLMGSQTSLAHDGSGFSVTAYVSAPGRRVACGRSRDLHFKHSSATYRLKEPSKPCNLFQTQSPPMKYGDNNTDVTKPCVWHTEKVLNKRQQLSIRPDPRPQGTFHNRQNLEQPIEGQTALLLNSYPEDSQLRL